MYCITANVYKYNSEADAYLIHDSKMSVVEGVELVEAAVNGMRKDCDVLADIRVTNIN